jgi:hypothetical protein
MQMGRDVPNGIKLHRWNALRLGLSVWKQAKASDRARRKMLEEQAEGADVGRD